MKSYYEILGIEQDADVNQIKRAYFKLVREYPPERFPKEFKQLREAYDVLMDEELREEYDRGSDLPSDIKAIFDDAKKLRKAGLPDKALENIRVLQRLYPEEPLLKAELAYSYECVDKYGKAIEIWKELYEKKPNSAEYSLNLATSYHNRGWNKKAAEQFKITTEIDPGCSKAWEGLINYYGESREINKAHEICNEALVALSERNNENVIILTVAISGCLKDNDKETAIGHLKRIGELLRSGTKCNKNESEKMFTTLFGVAKFMGYYFMAPYLKDFADFIPDLDGELKEKIYELEILAELEALEEEGVPQLFIDLFENLQEGCDCDECTSDITAIESSILMDLDGYRSHILRLKTKHPVLYQMHAAFFKEATMSSNPDKLLYYRLKELAKKGFTPDFTPADGRSTQVSETVRRESAKVGRNDPCPCGSGKKYKKCCG
jgi:curved DNA-binding protein CbpA